MSRAPVPTLRRTVALIAGVVLLAGPLAACGGSDGDDPSGGDDTLALTIGWVNDLTGPLSGLGGIEETNAAKLAAKKINAAGGPVKVTLKIEDSKSTTAAAIAATQRLAREKVSAMSGYAFTQNGAAAAPLLAQQKVPTVFVSVTALKNRAPNVFSMDRPNGELQTYLVEKYLTTKNVKRLAIVWQEQPTLADNRTKLLAAARSAGMQVVADQGASLTTTDLSSQVASVIAAKPDAVSLDLLAQQAGTTLSALRAGGYTGLVVSQLGVVNPVLPKTAGDVVDGLVVPSFWAAGVDNAKSKEFVDGYAAEYPSSPTPNLFGMMAYDAVHVLATAAEKAGSTDRDAIQKQLDSATFDTGMNSSFTFGDDGFGTLVPLLITYEAGKPVPLKQ